MVESKSKGVNNCRENLAWVDVSIPEVSSSSSEMDRLLTADSPPSSGNGPNLATTVVATPIRSENPSATSTTLSNNETQASPPPPVHEARVVASGTAGCILGCLLGGPVCAILAGFGTAYAAKHKDGALGDCARAVGDVALTAKSKAEEVDEKHHVVENTKRVVAEGWEHAKDLDRQHHICEKTKDAAVYTSKAIVNFTIEHRLLERGMEGVGRVMEQIGRRLNGGNISAAATSTELAGSAARPVEAHLGNDDVPTVSAAAQVMPETTFGKII